MLLETLGFNIATWDALWHPSYNAYTIVLDISCMIGDFCTAYLIVSVFLYFIDNFTYSGSKIDSDFKNKWFSGNKRSFFLLFFIFLLVYTSHFIVVYPGVITPDALLQINQSVGLFFYGDHQPILGTLLIGVFCNLGEYLFGSVFYGVVLFSIFQIILISFASASLLIYMAKRDYWPALRALVFLFLLLHPIVVSYTATMWKDVWIAYFLLLYTVLTLDIIQDKERFFKSKFECILLVVAMLGILSARKRESIFCC